MLHGMVLGDRSTLDDSVETAMKNTGLTQIAAVSRTNCSYLLAYFFLAARFLRMPRAAGVLRLRSFP